MGDKVMLSEQLLQELTQLNRTEKFRVVQILVSELAKEETPLDEQLPSGAEFEIWSPFDAYEAAETLQAILGEHKRKHDHP
jgi:hypothetical protein